MDEKKPEDINMPEENLDPTPKDLEPKTENYETLETVNEVPRPEEPVIEPVSLEKPETIEPVVEETPVVPIVEPEEVLSVAEKTPNSIEKTQNEAPAATLNQSETDKVVSSTQEGNIPPAAPKDKRNKKSKAPIIITVLLILIIALVGLYMFFSNNPKTIFVKSVDTIFNKLQNNMKEPKYEINKVTGDFSLETDSQDLAELAKIKLNFDVVTDNKNNQVNAMIKSTYENNHLIDANMYMENGKTYLYSADLFDKYIDLSSDTEKTTTPDMSDIKTMAKSLNVAVTKAVEGEKFTGTKIETKVDSENVKTYKSSLIIDKNNADRILTTIGDTLKSDSEFVKVYAKTSNMTTDEAKTEITKEIDSTKKDIKEMETVTINLYTKGFKQEFVKAEITAKTNDVTDVFSITRVTDEKYTYIIDTKSEQTKVTGTLSTKTDKDKVKVDITAKMSEDGKQDVSLAVKVNSNVEKASSVEKPDLTKAVKTEALTEADTNYMYQKIFANPALIKLIVALS